MKGNALRCPPGVAKAGHVRVRGVGVVDRQSDRTLRRKQTKRPSQRWRLVLGFASIFWTPRLRSSPPVRSNALADKGHTARSTCLAPGRTDRPIR